MESDAQPARTATGSDSRATGFRTPVIPTPQAESAVISESL